MAVVQVVTGHLNTGAIVAATTKAARTAEPVLLEACAVKEGRVRGARRDGHDLLLHAGAVVYPLDDARDLT